jgi:hypothetical protein
MKASVFVPGAVALLFAFLGSRYVFPVVDERFGPVAGIIVLGLCVYVPARLIRAWLDRRSNSP